MSDQVGCEWVSVSSGTGLPGLSWTKAVKRLCVCVCVVFASTFKQAFLRVLSQFIDILPTC